MQRTNVYAGVKEQILKRFSNASEIRQKGVEETDNNLEDNRYAGTR